MPGFYEKSKPRLIVIEKPVSTFLKEALRMKEEALRNRVPVMVNHERRFSRDYILLRKMISEKRLLNPVMITGSLYTPSAAIKKDGGTGGRGSLVRDGTHLFDTVNFLSGKRTVIDRAWPAGHEKNGTVSGISCMGRAGKIPAIFNIGFKTEQFVFEIDIMFQKGRAVIGNRTFKIERAAPSRFYSGFYSLAEIQGIKGLRKTGFFSGMVNNCVDFLDGKEPLGSSIDDGIEPLRCIEKIGKLLNI